MKRLVIYFFLIYLFAWKLVSYAEAKDKYDEVIFTEQAQLIFTTTLHDWKDLYDLPSEDQIRCMAQNIYFEARAESMQGKTAVGFVTINRVNDNRWPETVWKVVHQGPHRESWKTKQDPDLSESERIYLPIRHKCQFSWYCDGKSDEPRNETGWAQAQYVAGAIMYSGKYRGISEGATHYHATYVKPKWRFDRGMNHIGRIGAHIFYRWD